MTTLNTLKEINITEGIKEDSQKVGTQDLTGEVCLQLTFNVSRNVDGTIHRIFVKYNNKAIRLFNNCANELKTLDERPFRGMTMPISLTGVETTCTAKIPTLLTVLRRWLGENVLTASKWEKVPVSVMCGGDATEEDFKQLILRESNRIKNRLDVRSITVGLQGDK